MIEYAYKQDYEFKQRVGKMDFQQLQARGILPDSVSGYYHGWRPHERFLQVCKLQPDLHVLSHYKEVSLNYYKPDAPLYALGDGDCDPKIVHCKREPTVEDFRDMYEEIMRIPEAERNGANRFMLAWAESVLAGAEAFDTKNILQIAKSR